MQDRAAVDDEPAARQVTRFLIQPYAPIAGTGGSM
jgi:hypothetical protein